MSYDEYAWRSFLTEVRKPAPKPKCTLYERKLLREIDEEEVEHVRSAIDNMGAEELAFNDLFEGKTRLVLDFPTMDTSSDLGKFVDMFRVMGYDVNWEKGLISGERELKDGSISASVAQLTGTVVPPPKKRKVQMKVGKFWAKIYELSSKREALTQKVFDYLENEGYYDGKRSDLGHSYGRLTKAGQLTGNMIAAALDESEQKRYQQLADQLEMYLEDGVTKLDSSADAKKNQEYWQQNADYIKKNIGDLSQDKYVIIVTRDPIDILRMSDFNQITSCHTPPSRGGGDSYYKCAVAEAHGHGAIAYVVEKEKLLESTASDTIEDAEKYIFEYDGEIFADDIRGSHIGLSTELLPVARLRLRQVRAQVHHGMGAPSMTVTEVAVPETRVYGLKIPGFRDRVFEWAKESQATMIESIPEDATWIKYGGSYEDNNIKGLLHALTGRELERVGQNTETEDSIDDDVLLGGLVRRTEQECEDFADYWNGMYQACEVDFNVVDDGGGGIYIDISASMQIQWDESEWASMPNDVSDALSELNDMGWGWASANQFTTHLRRVEERIVLKFSIDPEGLPDFGAQGFAYDSGNFEDFCVEVNTVDDMLDGVKGELERIFKREGYMEGGALNNFGHAVYERDFTAYEWQLEAEEEDYMQYYGVEATAWAYPDYPDGMSPEDVKTILMSREFSIPLRKALVEHAWIEENSPPESRHYPNMITKVSTLGTGENATIRLYMVLSVNDNSSEAQVESMKATIEHNDDEDELAARVQAVFNQVVGEHVQTTDDRTEDTPPVQPTNESIVRGWKNFLHS